MKKSFLPLLALVALASCTQNDMDLKGSDEQAEIKLTSSALSIDASVTRAPFVGATIDATHQLTAKVIKATSTGDYSTAYEGVMEFVDGNAIGFQTPQFYPVDPSVSVFLAGLYPESASWAVDATNKNTYNITVLGNEDLMFAKEVKTSKADALASPATYKNLAFAHALTKLDVKMIAEDANASTEWGKVKAITLKEVAANQINTDMIINLQAGTATISTSSAMTTAFPFYLVDNTTTPVTYTDTKFDVTGNPSFLELAAASAPAQAKTEAKHCAYSLVAPFNMSGSNKTIGLNILTEKSDAAGYDLTVPVTLDASNDGTLAKMQGKSLTITLVFKASEINATATVVDWVDGGTADGTIE